MRYIALNSSEALSLLTAVCIVIILTACDQNSGTSSAVPQNEAYVYSSAMNTTVEDEMITAKVKSSFLADPMIKNLAISVETKKGEVQLSGFVESQMQADRAAQLARMVEGVKTVDNKLGVRASTSTVGMSIDGSHCKS